MIYPYKPKPEKVAADALPLPKGASTEATQQSLLASLGSLTKPGDIQTVSVNNFPATQPVSGTFWQATQPISGSVSIGNFPATQPISAASLPLPANAAQETGGNIASIKTNLDEIALDADNLPGINTQVSRLPTPLFGLSASLSYGVSILAACSASEPSLMDGQVSMPSLTPDGRIRVNLDDEPTGLWGADDEDDIWALDQDSFNLDAANF